MVGETRVSSISTKPAVSLSTRVKGPEPSVCPFRSDTASHVFPSFSPSWIVQPAGIWGPPAPSSKVSGPKGSGLAASASAETMQITAVRRIKSKVPFRFILFMIVFLGCWSHDVDCFYILSPSTSPLQSAVQPRHPRFDGNESAHGVMESSRRCFEPLCDTQEDFELTKSRKGAKKKKILSHGISRINTDWVIKLNFFGSGYAGLGNARLHP